MISIYPSDERSFKDNGVKILHPLKALIYKEDNGDYRIDVKDTIDNLKYYQEGLIIRTDTPWGKQGFRLTNPEINNNIITCKGYHLYFDTKRYIIVDSYVVDKNCNDAIDHLNNACDVKTPFNLISDIAAINSYRCIRHTLEEALSVVIERWGGHLKRDNFNIEIRQNIGQDRGVTLSYGRNIKTIKSNENWNNVVTKLLPVGKDGLTLPEIWIENEEKIYDIPYSKVVSFDQSEILEDDYKTNGILDEKLYKETLIADLRAKANEYIKINKLPQVNYTLSASIKDISDVGDTIYVKHPKCNIDITTTVIAVEYDCIANQYTKIEFGNFKNKLGNLINNVKSSIMEETVKETQDTYSKLQKELDDATNKINEAMGSSYVINDDGSQILIVDKLPKEEAKYVIRANRSGIGFSQNGINGTFNSAWTIDGTLNMQNINVINLIADMIKGGTLKLGSNLNESGLIELYDTSNRLISTYDKNGLIFYCDDNSYVKINSEVGFAGYDAQGQKTYWVDGDEFHQRKSVVEEEITIASKMREIPMTLYDETGKIVNDGVGFVALV